MSKQILEKLLDGNPLDREEISLVFSEMFAGKLSDSQIASFITAWRLQGEDSLLLHTAASFLRQHATKFESFDDLRPLSDNCGTGGSGIAKFNISTAAAIVASAAGARIAKHGNRNVSGVCGSADLLFEAGLPDNLSHEKILRLLRVTGFCFFFAPNFHPVMKHVMPARKSLGIRTVFNLLGPLANPIAPDYQVIGVSLKKHLRPMAEALNKFKVRRGLVVHSRDGLDEISPSAITDGILIHKGKLKTMTIDPKKFKINTRLAEVGGGSPAQNLKILKSLLKAEKTPVADAVVLNAGALLWVNELCDSIGEGMAVCRDKLATGMVKKHFENWLELAKQ